MGERLVIWGGVALTTLLLAWMVLTLVKGPEFECSSSRWEGDTYVPMECHWE